MPRRSGATLVEVLVAIFVMGIGMLTLLVLFPIGVLTMAQAIQDDRTARAVENAVAIANMFDYRQDPQLDPFFNNPDNAGAGWSDAQSLGPSYPIYLDPVGRLSFSQPHKDFVAGQGNVAQGNVATTIIPTSNNYAGCTGIRRVDPSYITNLLTDGDPLNDIRVRPNVSKYFISADDIEFDENAVPRNVSADPTNPQFKRNSTYSWAYLLRRPMNDVTNVVEMNVIVYNKRPLTLDARAQPDETLYAAHFDPTNNVVTLSWAIGGARRTPNLRLGDWILDTTPVKYGTKWGPPHANFYRVVSITENAPYVSNGNTIGSVSIEVQTPIRDFPNGVVSEGLVTVLDGVAEVFQVRVEN